MDTVTVTWGKQLIAPVQYNNFEVGPFVMTSEVRPGEKPSEAMTRVYAVLEGFARESYKTKIAAFREAFAAANQAVRGR
jgi:hypothetical protein